MEVLVEGEWRARQRAHEARIDAATTGHRDRRRTGSKHPVEDFLFTYYTQSLAALRRWHPGIGVGLAGAANDERAGWRFARVDGDVVSLDVEALLAARGDRVRSVARLLRATLERPAQFGCFGLHEWAMVHRLDQTGVRHPDWPLRLGPSGTDAVVESHQIGCSHVDAFRFFTPTARPLNTLQPTRADQVAMEQPGCLHAGMDCYKWAFQLSPATPSGLVADCFDLARDIRGLDMRASPYDLRDLGYEPVAIETREGKAVYVEAQRGFTARSQELRGRLLDVAGRLLDPAPTRRAPAPEGRPRYAVSVPLVAPVPSASAVVVAGVEERAHRGDEQEPDPRLGHEEKRDGDERGDAHDRVAVASHPRPGRDEAGIVAATVGVAPGDGRRTCRPGPQA